MKRNDYDGSGKLGEAIAALYGCSPKNNNRIAELVANAKAELGIISKTKKLPDDVKRAIYQWHYDRLHGVKIDSQTAHLDNVELSSQHDECKPVELFSQDADNKGVELSSQVDGDDAVNIISQYPDTALVRIAFNIQKRGKRERQVIALHGFYINALMLATGITKPDVPKWVQTAVDSWAAFDAELPITLQVKLLLVRELTKAIEFKP